MKIKLENENCSGTGLSLTMFHSENT